MPITNALTPDLIAKLVGAANGKRTKQSTPLPAGIDASGLPADIMGVMRRYLGQTNNAPPAAPQGGSVPDAMQPDALSTYLNSVLPQMQGQGQGQQQPMTAAVDPNAAGPTQVSAPVAAPAQSDPAYQMPALPKYDGSNIGHGSDAIRQLSSLAQLFGLVSPGYAAQTAPWMTKALTDSQTSDADKAYARQQAEYEDTLQAQQMQLQDKTRRDTATQSDQYRRDVLKQRDDQFNLTQGTKDKMAFDHIQAGMIREMQQAYDPSDPKGSAERQQQILQRDAPALSDLNPAFDPSMYYSTDGNFTPVVDQSKASGIEHNDAVIARAHAQTLKEALSSINSEGFWSLSETARQAMVHQLETAAGLQQGTLGVPVDGQSFADKMKRMGVEAAVKRVKDQETSDAWHHVLAISAQNTRDRNTDSEITARSSQNSHRDWQENGGGKDPSHMTLHELATLRNTTRSQIDAIRKQIDDPKQSLLRSDDATKALEGNLAAAQANYNDYDQKYRDLDAASHGKKPGNITGDVLPDEARVRSYIGRVPNARAGKLGCADGVCMIMHDVGLPVPKTSVAKDLVSGLKPLGWKKIPLSQVGPNDIIAMPSAYAPSGVHVGVAANSTHMVDDPGKRSGGKMAMSEIPSNAEAYTFDGDASGFKPAPDTKRSAFKPLAPGIVAHLSKSAALDYAIKLMQHKQQQAAGD